MSQNNYVRFLAAGDLHIGLSEPERMQVLFDGVQRHPEAAFMAIPGDLTNAGEPEQYDSLLRFTTALPMPFYGTMGNHETHTGPDEEARERFKAKMGVESASYVRRIGTADFVFLSTDGDIDGCSVDIRDALPLLEKTITESSGPVIAFCHAPLSGTVGEAPGRKCFLSEDPSFGLRSSADVRRIVRESGKRIAWFCGHTHSPLAAEGLFHTENLGDAVLHSVNVSCPYYTGRDFVQTEPITLYVCTLSGGTLEVVLEDASTGDILRRECLSMG